MRLDVRQCMRTSRRAATLAAIQDVHACRLTDVNALCLEQSRGLIE